MAVNLINMTEVEATTQKVDEYLYQIRERGGRITDAKRQLILTLLNADEHLTADQIYDEIAKQLPRLSISTVYRILEEFEIFGIATHTHFGHSPATYELYTVKHIHLICEKCDSIESIPHPIFRPLVKTLRNNYGFITDMSHFAIPGICKKCLEKMTKI